MPDTISCPQCGKALSVPESLYGTQVQCPACGVVFTAGESGPKYAPPSPRPADKYQDEPPPRRRDYDDRGGPGGGGYDGRRLDYDDRDRDYGHRGGYDDDYRRRDVQPHRGGLILTLGIIGLIVSLCPLAGWILGGIATSMANSDLSKMNVGSMDRDGRGQTETGKLLGTIALVIATISFILGCIINLSNMGGGGRFR